jgi:hypothetical protein
MKPEKTNPPEVYWLGGEVTSGGSEDESARLPTRLERYGKARKRARQMLVHLCTCAQADNATCLQGDKLQKATVRLRECGEYLGFHHYYTVGKVRLTMASFCKQHLICPLCAIRRGAKSLKAYLDRFEVIRKENPALRPYMVTFTVKNGDDLAERFQHLQDSIKRLHKHRRDYLSKGRGWTEAAKAEGAVWSYEVTNIGNGWHPHCHAIWLCEDVPSEKALRAEWERITGDSFMVDVRPIAGADPAEGFSEVFKYAVKFAGLELADNVHAWDTLHGRRLLGSFGAFRGVQIPEDLTDEPLDGLPYAELFYRYAEGAGYSLKSVRPIEGESAEPEALPPLECVPLRPRPGKVAQEPSRENLPDQPGRTPGARLPSS